MAVSPSRRRLPPGRSDDGLHARALQVDRERIRASSSMLPRGGGAGRRPGCWPPPAGGPAGSSMTCSRRRSIRGGLAARVALLVMECSPTPTSAPAASRSSGGMMMGGAAIGPPLPTYIRERRAERPQKFASRRDVQRSPGAHVRGGVNRESESPRVLARMAGPDPDVPARFPPPPSRRRERPRARPREIGRELRGFGPPPPRPPRPPGANKTAPACAEAAS